MLASRADSRHRRDVAVAGGGEGDDRVVEAVEQGEPVFVDVPVTVPVHEDDCDDRGDEHDREPEPRADRPQRVPPLSRKLDHVPRPRIAEWSKPTIRARYDRTPAG